MHRNDCMVASLCLSNTQSHSAMSIGSRKDWDEYLQECFCKVLPGMRTLGPPTSVIIEEIIELPVDLGVPALEKKQTLLAIEGFAPLILSLLGIIEPSPRFV